MTFWSLLNKADQELGIVLRWFSIACMIMLGVVCTAVVLVRFIPIASLSWSDEAIEWAFAWMVFMGAAALCRQGDHFCVDALGCQLAKTRWRAFHQVLVEVLAAIFYVMFTYYSLRLTLFANDRSPMLEWPRPIWYACMPVSGAMMTFYSFRNLIRLLGAIFFPSTFCPPPDQQEEAPAPD